MVLLRLGRQLFASERPPGQEVAPKARLLLRLLVLARLPFLMLLPLVELLALGLERKRHACPPITQLRLLATLLVVAGLLPTVEPIGHEVVVTASLLEPTVALAGQFGHQGRVSFRLRPPLLGRAHEDFPRPLPLHPSVEWLSDVLLHVVLRLLAHPLLAWRARADPLAPRPPVFLRPWLTWRLPLVQLHRPEIRSEIETSAEQTVLS